MNIELQNALNRGVVNVTFTKVNGEKRTMRATKNPALYSYTAAGPARAERDGITVMWDLDKKEFRSMRNDCLISFTAE